MLVAEIEYGDAVEQFGVAKVEHLMPKAPMRACPRHGSHVGPCPSARRAPGPRGIGWQEWHRQRDSESRHKRGYGSRWEKIRAEVLAQEPLCRQCNEQGRVVAAVTVDHIVPKASGGTDERSNLQPLCKACHDAKTAREVVYGDHARARVPCTLVAGPPGAGKTTLARERMRPGDLLVDLDAIFEAISGLDRYDDRRAVLLPFALEAREAMVRRLARPSEVRHAWVLTTEGDRERLEAMAKRLGGELLALEVAPEQCLARIAQDPARQASRRDWGALVARWWAEWQRAPRVEATA